MKYLVLLSCLLVVVYGIPPELVKQFKDHMMQIGGECKGEVGASDDDIAPMLQHKPPTTPKGKCFVACVNKKMGFQDASGKIDSASTYAWLEKLKGLDAELYNKMKVVVDNCLAEVKNSADECDTALDIFTCVKREENAAGLEQIDWNS